MIGETILDRYEVVSVVGQGGMAVVYKAVDRLLARQVAVKVLHPHLSQRLEARERFHREARIIARLRHPNVVEVYDYSGEDSEKAFIVQEFVAGETFASFLARHGPLLPEVAALVIALVARALHHAHSQGIVHRDIKPENIMIRHDGVLKLMDFGIAHAVDMEHLTVTGMILGSPAHMSPEQVEGRALDARTDIFSLGTMFFQAATGRLPFQSDTAAGLLRAVSEAKVPDIRTIRPGFPDDLYKILMKMMARDPNCRYPSAKEVADDLEGVTKSLGLEPAEVEVPRVLRDPEGRQKAIREFVAASRLERANALIRERKYGEAIRELDVALQNNPGQKAIQEALRLARSEMRKTQVRKKTLRIFMLSVTVTTMMIAGIYALSEIFSTPQERYKETPLVILPSPRSAEKPGLSPRRDVERVRVVAAQSVTSTRKMEKPKPQVPEAQQALIPVTIVGNPPAVRILVDDKFLGTGSTGQIHLPPGKHKVTLSHPKCDVCRETIYEIFLDPKNPPKAPLRFSVGYLDALLFVSGPEGAKVLVDGLPRGIVGKAIRIPMSQPGPVEVNVAVEENGKRSAAKRVVVAPGSQTSVALP